ncbi:MAG TPA: hypothetical protein VGU01_07720 [Sphingomicrobium sp.]|nr:hypothetical protein [Sphingomicrobium sp.]
MALFYFALIVGLQRTDDDEGQEIPNWEAARRAAVRSARSIMSADVLDGHLDLDGSIEVTNSNDGSTETVRFRDVIEITA